MKFFTKNFPSEKQFKNFTIYNILRTRTEASRADLTDIMKINAVSISNYTNTLIKNGFLVEREMGASSGGRPPILLGLNNNKGFTLGLHITKQEVSSVLMDMGMKVVRQFRGCIGEGSPAGSALKAVNDLTGTAETSKITGTALCADNVPAEALRDIENDFNGRYGDVYSVRPAFAAAFAEITVERNNEEGEVLYSYGDLGECVLAGKETVLTHEDRKGEHTQYLRPWGDEMGVASIARQMIAQGKGTMILAEIKGEMGAITPRVIFDAAEKNDTLASEILEFAGINLGVRIAYLVNVFRPRAVIIGDEIRHAGEHFIGALRHSLEKFAVKGLAGKTVVEYGITEDGYAAAAGAAALVIREQIIGV
ncbi:MAG: ROK family protein [Candidatus Omnitrophota bacterium]